MRRAVVLFLALLTLAAASPSAARDMLPVDLVRNLLGSPATELSFAEAKLAVDHFADPSVDEAAGLKKLDSMADSVPRMLSTFPAGLANSDMERMKALRTLIYQPGWWNDQRPFRYNLSDPLGRRPGAQLLTRYLATREGNCVSMPMLFLSLGERLGLDMTLSTAPQHIFVKFTDRATGQTWNLETTSGAGFTRDEHYRTVTPMSDLAVANGVYLKKLSRREALSVIATSVVDTLLVSGRYEEAIAVADLLIAAYPANAYALAKKGTAYYRLLERDFISRYPREADIPADERPRAIELSRANSDAFAKAEALGWSEPDPN